MGSLPQAIHFYSGKKWEAKKLNSLRTRKYWKVLKGRLNNKGSELVTKCYQLKMVAGDGKMRATDSSASLHHSPRSCKAADSQQTMAPNIPWVFFITYCY